jgi:hypothetical protein
MNPILEDFKMIRSAAEKACEEIVNEKLNDVYNPGDLHCSGVTWCVDEERHGYWEIRIEEAAPEASLLHAKLSARLKDLGFGEDFVVRTEW